MIKQAAQLFPESEEEQRSFLDALLESSTGKRPAVIWLKHASQVRALLHQGYKIGTEYANKRRFLR